jgi:predicted short-subunit dehydrogenase-like oxidoreductase (DUF2520 family)
VNRSNTAGSVLPEIGRGRLRRILEASGTYGTRTGTIDSTLLEGPLDLAIIGAGRVGTALGVLLDHAGHRIVAVSGRAATAERARRYLPGVPVLPPRDAVAGAQVVLLGVPDDHIQLACSTISTGLHRGMVVAHLSGALGLEPLASAAHWGVSPMALHPLQTVPDVDAGIKRIPKCAFAVTARDEATARVGERLARDAGGVPFRIRSEQKALYHAAAVFASNYLAVSVGIAEHLFRASGVTEPGEAYGPLAVATMLNVMHQGPAEALTGPVARGDVGTIERNLDALKQTAPEAIPPYVALARAAAELSERAGRLSYQDRRRVEEVLARWR